MRTTGLAIDDSSTDTDAGNIQEEAVSACGRGLMPIGYRI